MTKRDALELAKKLQAALRAEFKEPRPWGDLTPSVQQAWIKLARLAAAELKGGVYKPASKLKACRIDKSGRAHCHA